jgi:hypothetical protein
MEAESCSLLQWNGAVKGFMKSHPRVLASPSPPCGQLLSHLRSHLMASIHLASALINGLISGAIQSGLACAKSTYSRTHARAVRPEANARVT